jgi:hypothetical protein
METHATRDRVLSQQAAWLQRIAELANADDQAVVPESARAA